MQGNLVREKIEVDPSVGGSALFATQHAAIKATRLVQIGDVKSKMKKTVHARKHISHKALQRRCSAKVWPPRTNQAWLLALLRAIINSVLVLRSALTCCKVGRSPMRLR